jgi:hypothetical protein
MYEHINDTNYTEKKSFEFIDGKLKIIDDYQKNFHTLIGYIYERYKLDHNAMAREYTNLIHKNNYDHEDDEETHPSFRYFADGDEDLNFIFTDTGDVDPEDIFKSNTDLVFDLNNYLKNNDANTLSLSEIITICVYNKSHINRDPRGIRRLDWMMLYHNHYKIEAISDDIKLSDLRDALYRIKSHKFDMWYELYTSCKYKHHDDESRTIILSIKFDHGS